MDSGLPFLHPLGKLKTKAEKHRKAIGFGRKNYYSDAGGIVATGCHHQDEHQELSDPHKIMGRWRILVTLLRFLMPERTLTSQ